MKRIIATLYYHMAYLDYASYKIKTEEALQDLGREGLMLPGP